MQIHTLKLKKRKAKKIIGRGGNRGTYSGRGIKGQKSRSGASVNPLFEGGRSSLTDRMKKKRGFKSVKIPVLAISLEKIAKKIAYTDIIDVDTLIRLNLIKKKDASRRIKIIGSGTFEHKFIVDKNILFSKNAKAAIEKSKTLKKEAKTDEKSDPKSVARKIKK